MMRILANTVAAELIKLRGLPAVLTAALGTVGAAIGLAAAVAASSRTEIEAVQVVLLTIPFLQAGLLLIGVLAASSEYSGSQIRTTLVATPDRALLLAAKALAFLAVALVLSATTVVAGLATARITLSIRGIAPAEEGSGWVVAGAGAYLVLIGLLSLALAVLLRSLIPPLVAMLALVLIASPLLGGYTEHARWLPDRAGRLLYLPAADSLLTAGTGVLVLLAWIVVTGAAAAIAFVARDA